MTRRSAACLAALTLAAAGSGARVRAKAPQQVFRAAANVVIVDVAVTDRNKPVAGLAPADFDIRDNGVAQTATGVEFGNVPIDLRVVFDTSGSLSTADLERYTLAMRQVAAALHPDDRWEVLSFRRSLQEIAPLQAPSGNVAISRAGTDGTSFFDAAILALMTVPRPGRRQLTIFLTDGLDTTSFFDAAAMDEAARRTDAVVDVVSPVAVGPAAEIRAKLAADTGGMVFATSLLDGRPNASLADHVLSAVEAFKQSYVVHYTPTGVPGPGWHDLDVSIRGQRYAVRARRGYVGG